MKARILPFFDSSMLYNSMNMSFFQQAAPNATSLTTMVDTFLCPSDANVPCGTYDVGGIVSRQVGYTSYPNNLGTTPTNYGGRYDGPAYFMGAADVASVSGLAPTVTLAGITDGTSSTVIWSEIVRGKNGTTTPGPNQVYLMSLPMPSTSVYVPLNSYVNACARRDGARGVRSQGTDLGHRLRGPGGRLRAHHAAQPEGLHVPGPDAARGVERGVRWRQFVPSGRRERRLPRRLGPVREGWRRPADVVGHRDQGRRRGDRRGQPVNSPRALRKNPGIVAAHAGALPL